MEKRRNVVILNVKIIYKYSYFLICENFHIFHNKNAGKTFQLLYHYLI